MECQTLEAVAFSLHYRKIKNEGPHQLFLEQRCAPHPLQVPIYDGAARGTAIPKARVSLYLTYLIPLDRPRIVSGAKLRGTGVGRLVGWNWFSPCIIPRLPP